MRMAESVASELAIEQRQMVLIDAKSISPRLI